jgi:hypothetical protein
MKTITRKKVNKQKVRPVKIRKETRPIKGAEICPELYFNMLEVASTNVGKTTVTAHVIDNIIGEETVQVIAFVSSLYNDPLWQHIEDEVLDKDIDFVGHLSIKEDGQNLLKDYLLEFTEEAKKRQEANQKVDEEPEPQNLMEILARENGLEYYLSHNHEIIRLDDPKKAKPKVKKPKHASPEYVFLFDDLGDEVKTPSYSALTRKSRHFHIATVTAIQDLKDIKPSVLTQMRVVLLFGRQPEDRIHHAWYLLKPPMPFDVFFTLYKDATTPEPDDPKPFFYVNVKDNLFGRNFDSKYFIPDEYMN